ncbi:MAG TPA: hypothetical protein V6D18_07290 [Thermosynechococcaceae cyanobacterium]
MITQFITLEVKLLPQSVTSEAIEAELRKHGQPLRWAITSVVQHIAVVEALVTLES